MRIRVISATVRNYYQFAKPGIIYGNLITALAGFMLASVNGFNVWLCAVTMAGIALVMASGCVYNNITDRRIDALMNRTKRRALVTKTISVKAASIYGTILVLIGFLLLAMWTNWLTVLIGLIGFIDYVVLYALAKRASWHGTLVGTISGATPLIAGYVAVTGTIDSGAAILFLVMVFWQMAHFYAIALFRAQDYKKAGIPVISLVKGISVTKTYILIYILLFTLATLQLPLFGYGGYVFAIVMIFTGAYWLYSCLYDYRTTDTTKWSKKVFKKSLISLLVFSFMISISQFLP